MLRLLTVVLVAGCATADVAPSEAPSPARVENAAITPERQRGLVASLPAERHAGSAGLAEAQSSLIEALARLGYATRLEPVPEAGDGAANVVAELAGGEAGVVLVGAHYDAVEASPSADDNASGVAVALEVARRLAGSSPRRTVRFAFFAGEELGLLGSTRHAAAGDDVVAVINLEMVGYFADEPGSQQLPPIPGLPSPPTVGDFLGVVANTASADLAATLDRHLRDVGMKTYVVDFIPGNGRLVPDTRRSDHAPFWDAGVPAVMLTDTSNFRNPHYHTQSDTIDTLDFGRMALVARGVEAAVRELAGASQPAR